ncbi:MAG: hypothetical protein AAFY28_12705 [Actinomycetota bacterium]
MTTLDGTVRIRSLMWFATGVALTLVVTLIVTQAWQVGAEGDEDGTTFTPVEPCRLADTRPDEQPDGPKKTPVGPGFENRYVQPVAGTNGNCMLPPDIEGIALNVTVVNPTAQSNLRLYPTGGEIPVVSNLNWLAGQSATANKVDVKVGSDQAIWVQNFKGQVDVVLDVVGYYGKDGLVRDFQFVETEIPVSLGNAGESQGGSINCPSGKRVISGSAVLQNHPTNLDWTRNGPSETLGSWTAGVTGAAESNTILIRAICASGVTVASG